MKVGDAVQIAVTCRIVGGPDEYARFAVRLGTDPSPRRRYERLLYLTADQIRLVASVVPRTAEGGSDGQA